MFTFIDPVNGSAFSGDSPYVFWYQDGQSVNLNYVLQICCYSSDAQLTISIDSDVFSVLAMDQLIPQYRRIEINKKKYIDIDDLKCSSYTSSAGFNQEYGDNYVHMFYICARSTEAGEVIDRFTISNNQGWKQEYSIGADFYNINEILQSNMENFEISLPESIQKAIYEVNIHEDANDNITINRKHKELLMNYWNIVANKGSYESLINSLKWFEWGDLVRLEESWKYMEPHRDTYQLRDIDTHIDTLLKSQLSDITKSTYIGLYYALQRIEIDQHGRVVYEDSKNRNPGLDVNRIYENENVFNPTISSGYSVNTNDPTDPGMIQLATIDAAHMYPIEGNRIYNEEVPVLLPIVSLWDDLDLCLKMTLLGNFYSTFFMPVHLDLIHSTIESWVYSNVIKLMHGTQVERFDTIDNTQTFDLKYEYK